MNPVIFYIYMLWEWIDTNVIYRLYMGPYGQHIYGYLPMDYEIFRISFLGIFFLTVGAVWRMGRSGSEIMREVPEDTGFLKYYTPDPGTSEITVRRRKIGRKRDKIYAECQICGAEVFLPSKCPYCRKYFCNEHSGPENHTCSSPEIYSEKSSTADMEI